jgi:hypothetical protein
LREGGEVDVEDVALDDFDIGVRGEALAETRGELAIEFDGDEAAGAGREQVRDGGFAGADFDDGAVGEVAEGIDNGVAGRGTDEEVLAKFRFVAR